MDLTGIFEKLPIKNMFSTRYSYPKKLLKSRKIIIQSIGLVIFIYLCYILGVFTHILEKDLEEYRYPLKIDIRLALETLNQDTNSAKKLDINNFNYTFLHTSKHICESNGSDSSSPFLIIIVKSKLTHFDNREAIRKTWGKSDELKLIRTVFLVGQPDPIEDKKIKISINNSRTLKSQSDETKLLQHIEFDEISYKLELENDKYGDIIQQNFYDTYHNNTIKTFMGIKWIMDYCSNSKFYLFIDDDYYLNPNLLMKYLNENVTESMMNTLYAGYVFANSSPMRHLLSKWYVSLKDYPYHKFPPYVTAGCYVLTLQSAKLFYLGSKLIESFKFDDIYMGILAHKLDIEPFHIEAIHFYAPSYVPKLYSTKIIAAHKFKPRDMITMWSELKNTIEFRPKVDF